jgi:oxygen-independent coproporphyrinogen-3 oxidase
MYKALYIHIPFCKKRCAYCDFTTEAADVNDARIDSYVDGLIRDVRSASRDGLLGSIETIYIGGGTPSFIGQKRLVNLVYTLSLSLNLREDSEFTLEANPESLTLAMIRDLFALGVNRFSLGVQSFRDEELAALGRVHTAERARRAVLEVRERCENVSVDLMCGIPGQTPASWEDTLEQALALGVTHVSVYPLTIEEDTPFAQMVARGTLEEPDEDLEAQMMERAAQVLEAAGLMRYEIASYARDGLACRHIKAYWTGLAYLGLGRGAAGMRNSPTGRERLLDGAVIERLSPAQALAEDLMLGMRMAQGVGVQQVRQARSSLPTIEDCFAELLELGLVAQENGRFVPTNRGWLLGNRMFGALWETASNR